MDTLKLAAGLALVFAALLIPGAASAATSPDCNQYQTPDQQATGTNCREFGSGVDPASASGNVADPPAAGTAGAEASGGSGAVGGLPFTGADLLALLAVAVCLLSTGFLFRRLANRQP
jgi:hypothetical protein